jgi:hypothetical protein
MPACKQRPGIVQQRSTTLGCELKFGPSTPDAGGPGYGSQSLRGSGRPKPWHRPLPELNLNEEKNVRDHGTPCVPLGPTRPQPPLYFMSSMLAPGSTGPRGGSEQKFQRQFPGVPRAVYTYSAPRGIHLPALSSLPHIPASQRCGAAAPRVIRIP